jgi:hypothetical protein
VFAFTLCSTKDEELGRKVMVRSQLTWALAIAACALPAIHVQAVEVSVPASPPDNVTVVKGNFLGVSFELSAFDKYCEFHPNYRTMVES